MEDGGDGEEDGKRGRDPFHGVRNVSRHVGWGGGEEILATAAADGERKVAYRFDAFFFLHFAMKFRNGLRIWLMMILRTFSHKNGVSGLLS